MLKVKGGDEFYLDLYYIKEHHLEEVVGKDGIVNKIPVTKARFLINPDEKYLNRENVEVVVHRRIRVQIMEVNRVGGRIVEPRFLIGLRFVEGNKSTPVFHIMVKNDGEFRERVIKELEYYLKVNAQAL